MFSSAPQHVVPRHLSGLTVLAVNLLGDGLRDTLDPKFNKRGRRDEHGLPCATLAVALPPGADRALAVEHISFDVNAGEILCLLGESGSGKSVISFAVMGLLPDNVHVSAGEIPPRRHQSAGVDVDATARTARRRDRDDLQEPMTALNPVMTCGDQLDELLAEHTSLSAGERKAKTLAMFDAVKLPEPERILPAIRTSFPAVSASAS